jgi:hypothetical protein
MEIESQVLTKRSLLKELLNKIMKYIDCEISETPVVVLMTVLSKFHSR